MLKIDGYICVTFETGDQEMKLECNTNDDGTDINDKGCGETIQERYWYCHALRSFGLRSKRWKTSSDEM